MLIAAASARRRPKSALTWRHLELSLDAAGVGRLFINGALRATGTLSKAVVPGVGPGYIGLYTIVDGGALNASVDNFRVTKGSSVRHTSNFTPTANDFGPSNDPRWADVVIAQPFSDSAFADLVPGRTWSNTGPVTLDTAHAVSGSTSGLFVTGAYLSTPHTTATNLDPPWTIDAWVYQPVYTSSIVCQFGQVPSVNAGNVIVVNPDGSVTGLVYTNDYPAPPALTITTIGP